MGCENLATKADIQALKQEISTLKAEITNLKKSLDSILSFLRNILTAIATLQNVLSQKLDPIASQIANVYKAVSQLSSTVSNGIAQILAAIRGLKFEPIDYSKIQGMINDARNNIVNAISQYITPIQRQIETIASQVTNVYKAVSQLSSIVSNGIAQILAAIRAIKSEPIDYSKIQGMINDARSNIVNALSQYITPIDRQLSAIASQIVNVFNAIKGLKLAEIDYSKIQGMINDARSNIVNALSQYLTPIDRQLGAIANGVTNVYNAIKSLKFEPIDYSKIEGFHKDTRSWLYDKITAFMNAIEARIGAGIARIENLIRNLKFPTTDLRGIENALSNANNTLSQIKQYNEQQFGIARESFKNVLDAIRNLPKVDLKPLEDLLKKIFLILGGTAWDNGYDLNPELDLKARAEYAFSVRENGTGTTTNVNCNSFIDFIQYVISVNYYRLGFQDYPIQVTEDLTEDLGEGQQGKQINLPTLSSFNTWQTKQIDAILGQFPFKIKIEDNDLITVGDQELELTFPNVAETLAELTGLLITTKAFLEANLETSMRTLVEVGSTKTQGVSTYYLLEAIQDYLGFKTKQKIIDVEFVFNPQVGLDSNVPELVSEALKNTRQKIRIEESDDKHSLEAHIAVLKEAAAIIKAVHWRKFNLNDTSELKNFFKDIVDFASNGEDEADKFEEFLERVERGFIDESGISNNTNPYGRPYDQRPKIKRIGDRNPEE